MPEQEAQRKVRGLTVILLATGTIAEQEGQRALTLE